MSATFSFAKEGLTGRVCHINEVFKNSGHLYFCVGCNCEMIMVKGEARKKEYHFRHKTETDCSGARDRALHNYAIQVILDNNSIVIKKNLKISYSNPRKEVGIFGKRSDVAVCYKNEDVHFEVFVTHDMEAGKMEIYKANKVKCIKINLSNTEWRTADPDKIKDAVLNQYRNKVIYNWVEEESTDPVGCASYLFGFLAAIGVLYLIKRVLSPVKRRRASYRK